MPFQNVVAVQPAIGIPGDFASVNPRQFVVSGTANQRMVAQAVTGALAGGFGYLNTDGTVTSITTYANASDNPSRIGFIHRYMGSGLIVNWLAESSMFIQPGQPVELFATGDFFAKADAITGTPIRGAAVIWDPAAGTINIGATAGASTVDTGFILLSEGPIVAGQTVMIGKNGA